jgi:hypothetical protein
VNSVLSVIGLALDAVGAVVLIIGLFRPARGLYPGYAYAPDDAARDSAFAVAGATLLTLGFAFQSLPYFGLTAECSAWVNGLASAAALIAGIVYALVAYEITHRRVFDWRREQGLRDGLEYPTELRRGLWFWRGRRPLRFWRRSET